MATMAEFRAALDRGDVVRALVGAPFGYTSTRVGFGYRFRIDDGDFAGNIGEASTLLEAVRLAAPSTGGRDNG